MAESVNGEKLKQKNNTAICHSFSETEAMFLERRLTAKMLIAFFVFLCYIFRLESDVVQ